MESNFKEALTVAKKPKKESLINRIVVENFGDWESFRNTIKDAWESIDYDPLENKSSQRRFTNGILQSYADKINPADFRKLSYLIMKEIKTLARHKEKSKSTKGKYV